MEVHPISALLQLPLPVYEVARSSNYDRVICYAADKGILGPVNVAGFGRVLGLGHDLVDLQEFGRQLAMPGTSMSSLFSTWERRQAERRCSSMMTQRRTRHALGPEPSPYALDNCPWSGVEILDDSKGRPSVRPEPSLEAVLYDCLLPASGQVDRVQLCWYIALSHDGLVASAVVLLCR